MKFRSTLTPRAYISALEDRMGSHTAFGTERYTGFFLGKCFLVTYHSGYEWNRRITNQKNAALGIVKKTENGSQVSCLLFRGALCPQYLIPYLVIMGVLLWLSWPVIAVTPPGATVLTLLILLGAPPVSALIESLTDDSINGRKWLLGLLIDPGDYFAYRNHQNEIR